MAASLEAQELELDEILAQKSLTREDVDKECSQAIIHDIGIKVIEWELLGYCLGIAEEKLAAIKRDHASEELRRVTMLQTWRNQEKKRATYLELMKALHRRESCNHLVDSLCDMIKSSSSEARLAQTPNQKQEECNKSGSNRPMGGFECKFTSNPTECPICEKFVRDPQTVSCCNENFCNDCIKEVKQNSRCCPMCNEYFEYSPNTILNEVLLEFAAKCTMKCGWEGPLGEHDEHVNTPGKCSKVKLWCLYCKKQHHNHLQCLEKQFQSSKLSIVYDITNTYEVRAKWEAIGRELNLSDGTLQAIAKWSDSYHEMLRVWIDTRYANWRQLLTAFRRPTVNLHRLATKIEQGLICDRASEHQVSLLTEKAFNLITESRTQQTRSHQLANVKERMLRCTTLLQDKAEDLEFEKDVKLLEQGLGKHERILEPNITYQRWIRRTANTIVNIGIEDVPNILFQGVSRISSWIFAPFLKPEEQKKKERIIAKYERLIKKCCDASRDIESQTSLNMELYNQFLHT